MRSQQQNLDQKEKRMKEMGEKILKKAGHEL